MGQRGFTLLEIIVATAILAILMALTIGGWRSVQESRSRTDEQAARLAELETTMTFFTRDLMALVNRDVRDEYGGLKPAIQGGAGSTLPLELSRAGWRNPAGRARSTLQRVAYEVKDEVLVRHAWRVLDRAQDSVADEMKLLKGVRSLKIRFYHPGRRWVEDWPPPAQGTGLPPAALPLAVELTIELEDLGTIGRIFRVPG